MFISTQRDSLDQIVAPYRWINRPFSAVSSFLTTRGRVTGLIGHTRAVRPHFSHLPTRYKFTQTRCRPRQAGDARRSEIEAAARLGQRSEIDAHQCVQRTTRKLARSYATRSSWSLLYGLNFTSALASRW